MSIRLQSIVITLVLLTALAPAHAQQQRPDEPPVCLGFSFGQWTPALDWKAAGHQTQINPATHQRADDGRDWATTQAVTDEHTIMLLPSWWPAGVNVTLPNRAPALGDTIVGSAFAFIADGRKKAPTAKVWAWRVPCSARAR
ncbi:MAG TPA: hypothetical protein VKA54_06910 [Gemmatimonadaceae bacterium]|nr:hypothetical protein [Gemmatimonadaceae bacterium]